MLYKPPHLTFLRLDFGITFKHGDKFGFGLERTLCSYSFPSEPSHGARVLGLGPFVRPVSACSDHRSETKIVCTIIGPELLNLNGSVGGGSEIVIPCLVPH
ncbi:hypothetical protein B296_00041326 [Ensete ventricosum]|uniref:Uncharacterized protein n=1 Tax=Ensete ventricosum TaxID=4639 RepID=A0A426ZA34_ENSVE|nr:hypothetical protein B296_00041326 [Ensete ventricosum]